MDTVAGCGLADVRPMHQTEKIIHFRPCQQSLQDFDRVVCWTPLMLIPVSSTLVSVWIRRLGICCCEEDLATMADKTRWWSFSWRRDRFPGWVEKNQVSDITSRI